MTTINKQIGAGIKWLGLGQAIRIATTLVTLLILARLLPPSDFGILALVVVFTQFAQIVVTGGLGASAIQKRDLTSADKNLIFWINVLIGGGLSLLVFFAAKPIAVLMGSQAAADAFRLSSPIFIITGITVIHKALLERAFAFAKVALIETTSTVIGAIGAIILAGMGYGAAALVSQFLITGLMSAVFFSVLSPWRPQLQWRGSSVRSILRFSGLLTLNQLLNFFSNMADRTLLSHFAGLSATGIYSMGSQLVQYPVRNIATVLERLMFPILSSIQDDDAELRRVQLHATHGICVVIFALMAGIAAIASPFQQAILGDKWSAVASVLPLLALRMSLTGTIGIGWVLFLVKGRPGLRLKLGIISSVITVSCFAIGVPWGLYGVALAGAISSIIWVPIGWVMALRLIDQPFGAVFAAVARPAASAIVMYLCLKLVEAYAALPALPLLGLQVALGLIIFVVMEVLIDRQRALSLAHIGLKRLKR